MVEALPLHAFGILRRPELYAGPQAAWELPSGMIIYLPRAGDMLMRRFPDGRVEFVWPEERDEQAA
jgi:hypothetical protein